MNFIKDKHADLFKQIKNFTDTSWSGKLNKKKILRDYGYKNK